MIIGEAGIAIRPEGADKIAPEIDSELSSSLPAVATKAAGYFAAAFAAGSVASGALEMGQFRSKLQAQLGLSNADAGAAGRIAGDVYAGNFGENLEQVYDATALVAQNIGVALDDVSFQGITENVLALSNVMGTDLEGTTNSVAQLMRNGLAPDAQSALDVVAAGFQRGANRSGDFLDTLNEYGPQFSKLGLDATAATGLLNQGLEAGARNTDIVADALKEFSIRAIDGSTLTQQSFAALGLSATDFSERIAAGGADSAAALDETLDALRNIEDPAARAQAAVGLFGTQAEDLGSALYSLDLDTAATGLGDVAGAAQNLADTAGYNLQGVLDTISRTIETKVVGSLDALIFGFMTGEAGADDFIGKVQDFGAILGRVGDTIRLGFTDGLDAVNDATEGVEGIGFQVLQVAGFVGNLGAIFRESFIDGAGNSALLAEDSLAGLATRAGDSAFRIVEAFRAAFASLVTAVSPAIGAVRDAFSAALPALQTAFSGLFSGLGGEAGSGLQGVVGVITSVLETVGPLIANYVTRYADLFAAVIPIVTQVITSLVPVVQTLLAAVGPLLESLLPIISQVADLLVGALIGALQSLVPIIPPLAAALGQIATTIGGALVQAVQALAPVIPTIVQAFAELAPIIAGALTGALTALLPVLPVIVDVLSQVAVILVQGLATALQAVIPIIPPLVGALSTVATILVGALSSALRAILPIIPSLVAVLVQLVTTAVVPLLPLLPVLANLLVTIIGAVAPLIPPITQIIALIIQLAVAAITPLLSILPTLVSLFTIVVGALATVVTAVVGVVGTFISFGSSVLSVVTSLVSTVVGVFTGFARTVGGIFSGIASTVSGIFSGIFSTVSGIASAIAGAISGAFSGARDAIVGVFSGVGNAVSSAFSAVGSAVRSVLNGAIGIINSGIGFINSNLIAAANKIPFVNIPNIPRIPTLHSGGYFDSGRPEGEGLALLRDGELVVTPEQQAAARIVNPRTQGGVAASAGSSAPVQVTIEEHLHAAPGESLPALAAQVTQGVAWNLNLGITRLLAGGAPVTVGGTP